MAAEYKVFDLSFSSPAGIGTHLERHHDRIRMFFRRSFGFVEAGPFTPEPQTLIAQINRKPLKGVLIARLAPLPGSSSEEEIKKDYFNAFSLSYDFADAFSVEVTSRNIDYLHDILDSILGIRVCYDSYKPVLVKVSPSLSDTSLKEIIDYSRMSGIDGVISERVKTIYDYTAGRFPIIACGAFKSPEEARNALNDGASLVMLEDVRPTFNFVKKTNRLLEDSKK